MTQELSFDERVDRRVEQVRAEQIDVLGDEPLIWLALAPVWNEPLARRCDFPAKDLSGFLDRAEAAGLCRRSSPGVSPRQLGGLTARALCSLLPCFPRPKQFVGRLERAMRQIGVERRAELLADLARRLEARERDGGVLEKLVYGTMQEAMSAKEPRQRANALLALLPVTDGGMKEEVRKGIDDALASIDDPEASVRVLAELVHDDPSLEPALRETFSALVDDDDLQVLTGQIAGALGRTGDPLFVSPLADRLHAEDAAERRATAATLAGFGKLAAAPLRTALADSDVVVRALAVHALGQIGAEEAVQDLSELARKGDERVREASIEALGRIGRTGTAPPIDVLLEALDEPHVALRCRAAQTLGRIGAAEAAPALGARLDDPAAEVRHAAAIALLGLPSVDPKTFDHALAEVRRHDDPFERARGLRIAAERSPEERVDRRAIAGEALSLAFEVDSETHRARLLAELAPLLDTRQANEALEVALSISDPRGRVDAVVGLAETLSPSQAGRAIEALDTLGDARAFWMPDSRRRELLPDLRRRADLREHAPRIGQRVLQARGDGYPVPVELVRWAQLAVEIRAGDRPVLKRRLSVKSAPLNAPGGGRPRLGGVARQLAAQLSDLVRSGRTGQAIAWLGAGESLAQALRGELEAAVLLGNRVLEAEFRNRQDERHLVHFLDRAEQLAAFDRLWEGDTDSPDEPGEEPPWALHYLGMGGVGKTMLLRRICQLARQREIPFSRIDFDYLSPDFPVRKPGQLLLELASELRSYRSVESLYDDLEDRAIELHERLSEDPPPDEPLANVKKAEFRRLLRPFTDMLHELGGKVLLILDTCEELAKVDLGDRGLPALDATYTILEAVKREVPDIRVIFAGRRPLAREGHDWKLSSPSEGERTRLPARKPYLAMHQILGFTKEQCREYLEDRRKLDLSDAMTAAVLGRSRDTGRSTGFTRPGGGGSAEDDGSDQRYHPFDIALYAEWIAEDPELPVETIGAGDTDPYIEMRIVRRIKRESVQAMVPAAVLLGRFDRDMLRPAIHVSDQAFDEAFRHLGDQEWVDFQRDEDLKTSFLEVDRKLLPRLREYYEHGSRRSLLTAARSRLAPGLEELIRTRDLRELNTDHVGAAMRLLPAEDAGRLWEGIERKVAEDSDWEWAVRVTGRLLATEGAIHPEHPLRAAVRATSASALLHVQAGESAIRDAWSEVERTAEADPDPGRRRWLRRRASSGIAACDAAAGAVLDTLTTELAGSSEFGFRELQLAAAVCAAWENVLDGADSPLDESAPGAVSQLASVLERADAPADLRAFVLTLVGRARIATGGEVDPTPFDRALDLLDEQREAGRAQNWLDWRAPDVLIDRVRLERLRAHCDEADVDRIRLALAPDAAEEGIVDDGGSHPAGGLRYAVSRLHRIDAERFVSFCLDRVLDHGTIDGATLDRIEQEEKYDPARRPRTEAHAETPPLFASVARGWLALGAADRALELLDARITEATRSGQDPTTVRDAQRVKLNVQRRMRLGERSRYLVNELESSQDVRERALAWPVLALTGGPLPLDAPQRDWPDEVVRAWWDTRTALDPASAGRLLEVTRDVLPDDPVVQKERALVEARLERPEAGGEVAGQGSDLEPLAGEGRRAAAERVLECAELMALRAPAQAAEQLELAARWFLECDDPVGATIASARAAIARAHAGDLDGARATLERDTRSSYDRVRASRESLPGWNALRSEAWKSVEFPPFPDWSDWFERIDRARSVTGDPAGKASLDPGSRPTPELDLDYGDRWTRPVGGPPGGEVAPSPAAHAPSPPARSSGSFLIRLGKTLLGAVFGIALIVMAVAAMAWGVGLVMGLFVDEVTSRQKMVGALVVMALFGFVPQIWRRIGSWWASRTRSEIAIVASEPVHGRELDAHLDVRLELTRREPQLTAAFPFVRMRQAEPVSAPATTPGLDDYGEGAGAIPNEIARPLRELSATLRYNTAPVAVRVESDLSGVAWEAVLRLAMIPEKERRAASDDPSSVRPWLAREKLRLYRSPVRDVEGPGTDAGRIERLTIISNESWNGALAHAWGGLGASPEFRDSFDLEAIARAQVIHIVSNPVRSVGGLSLEIGQTREFTGGEETAQLQRSETLVVSDPLLAATRVGLLVLQAEPLSLSSMESRRSASDRERAGELKRYARQIADAGARAVIVVPPLPAEFVEPTLRALVRELGRETPVKLDRLLEAVAAAQSKILRVGAEGSPWFHEIALDVCLFANDPDPSS